MKLTDEEWDRIAEVGTVAEDDRDWFEQATAPLRSALHDAIEMIDGELLPHLPYFPRKKHDLDARLAAIRAALPEAELPAGRPPQGPT